MIDTLQIASTEKGAVNGVATLDSSGVVPSSQLPTSVGNADLANATGVLTVLKGGSGVTTSTGTGSVVLSNAPTLTGTTTVASISGNGFGLTSLNLTNTVGTLSVAKGGSGVTTSTGTGNIVLSDVPTLIGNVSVLGNLSATYNVTAYASDARLKANIIPIPNALEKVTKLRGVSFDWREDTPQPMRGHDVGLIAQDVAAVLKEATTLAPFDRDDSGVSKSGDNYLTIDSMSNKLVALLVEAVKELVVRVHVLESYVKQP